MPRSVSPTPPASTMTHTSRIPRWRVLAAVAAASLVVGALVAVTAAGQGAERPKAAETLKLVLELDRFADARHDLDPQGDSPGDQVFSDDAVFDSRNRKRVGRLLTLRSFQEGHRVLVSGALRLGDGTITLAGVLVNGAPDLAVTGGTRAYAGARGTYHQSTKPIVAIVGDQPGRYALEVMFRP